MNNTTLPASKKNATSKIWYEFKSHKGKEIFIYEYNCTVINNVTNKIQNTFVYAAQNIAAKHMNSTPNRKMAGRTSRDDVSTNQCTKTTTTFWPMAFGVIALNSCTRATFQVEVACDMLHIFVFFLKSQEFSKENYERWNNFELFSWSEHKYTLKSPSLHRIKSELCSVIRPTCVRIPDWFRSVHLFLKPYDVIVLPTAHNYFIQIHNLYIINYFEPFSVTLSFAKLLWEWRIYGKGNATFSSSYKQSFRLLVLQCDCI